MRLNLKTVMAAGFRSPQLIVPHLPLPYNPIKGPMEEHEEFRQEREKMIEVQLQAREISDPRVLQAMRQVPRHEFVPESYREIAYSDAPLAIGHGQTISQPYVVALMTQLLELRPDDRVLEIGTGSGYQAAILSQLAAKVYTLERIPELASRAEARLAELGFENVEVIVSDGSLGASAHSPFQAILVTAAAPKVPEPLKRQLDDGGRLVLPVGARYGQTLERWRRDGEDFRREQVAPVAFVPLIGRHGWEEGSRGSSLWG
jgi:protein-L-isoaspartate(D-aspartate) O-methyltransferase